MFIMRGLDKAISPSSASLGFYKHKIHVIISNSWICGGGENAWLISEWLLSSRRNGKCIMPRVEDTVLK
jgi:hypothetical protein